MALDRLYPKKIHWIHREIGIGLEPYEGSKVRSSQKDMEKNAVWGHGSGEDMERG
jgi:hypothetical protein